MSKRILLLAVVALGAARPAPCAPVVAATDPTAVTHTLQCGEAVFGFNANGGGYLCSLRIKNGPNLIVPAYGRGGQTALRDSFHHGRYNPTQAGFLDGAGRPAELAEEPAGAGHGRRVTIKPFKMALYSDHVYDFVEHEDLVPDSYADDGGNSDHDNVAEEGLTQEDEIGCEMDYEGFYEDATGWVSNGVAVMRHVCHYDYIRPPKQILQFGAQGLLDNGAAVLNPEAAVTDISPAALPGPQAPSPADLSLAILPFSVRLNAPLGYRVVMWVDAEGRWQAYDLSKPKQPPVSLQMGEPRFRELLSAESANFSSIAPKSAKRAKTPLLLLAADADPDQASALAIYMPLAGPVNQKQFVGIETQTGKVAYEEDRRISLTALGTYRVRGAEMGRPFREVNGVRMANDLTLIKITPAFTGMLAPGNGLPGVHERLRLEAYVLLGSPNRILQAAGQIEARLGAPLPASSPGGE